MGSIRHLWLASPLALVVTTPGFAQTASPAPNASTAPAANSGAVGDIVVTAQRREERLQNVPIAITALDSNQLQKSDTTNITRLTNFVPGLSFGQSGQDVKPGIRGTRTAPDGGGDVVIGFYVDDVFQTLAVQASQPFVDVQRVEVARGPQGTLFGRNTFGGAISVVNAVPGDKIEYQGSVTLGNYDRNVLQGFVSLPITDTFGVRVAGYRERRDGYIKNVAFNGDPGLPGNDLGDRVTDYLRGTVRWAPTDSLEVVLRGTYWREGGTGSVGVGAYKAGGLLINPATGALDAKGTPLFFYSGVPTPVASGGDKDGVPDINGFDVGRPVTPDPYAWQGRFRGLVDLVEKQGNGQIRWHNDSIFLRSITGYQDFRYKGNAGTALGPVSGIFTIDRNTKTFTQELQIGSVATSPLQWIAGLYYYNERAFENFLIFTIPTTVSNPTTASAIAVASSPGPQSRKTDSYAGYAQASYNVTDALRLTAGGRYTRDKKELLASTFGQNLVTGARTDARLSIDRKATFSRFTWRLGADYKLNSDQLLYASVSTGFRSGGFNAGVLTNPLVPATFQPERVTAYEVGSKNRFDSGRVQLNAAFFYNDFKNLLDGLAYAAPNTNPPTIISAILNAGAARAYGVELEGIWKPVRQLTLNATAEFTNARYTDFKFVGQLARFYPVVQNDLSGNKMVRTPDHKFTVGASYDIEIPGFGVITPQANALISSSYYNLEYNTPLERQGAYATLDASLGYRTEDGRFSVEAFGTNLTNKAVQTSAAYGSASNLTAYGLPRFYGVRLTVRN